MGRLFVVPAPGLKVRDPRSLQQVPAAGAHVEDNTYWRRRLADGDVTIAEPQRDDAAPGIEPAIAE